MLKFIVLPVLFIIQIGFSHKVTTMIHVTGLEVEGRITFSSGHNAKKGTDVRVYNDNQYVSTIKIQEEGRFIYIAKEAGNYDFIVDLGGGHVSKLSIKASDFGHNEQSKKIVSPKKNKVVNPEITLLDLEEIIARQILPLRYEIQALKEKQKLTDIFGGMGFIIGFFGFFAWLQSRRRP